jgi:hypothetical protein
MHELELRRDVRAGVREAWFYIKLYMVQAVLAIALGGYVLLRRFPLLAIGLFPMYIVGGFIAGAIAGYLLPWCRRPLGAVASAGLSVATRHMGSSQSLGPSCTVASGASSYIDRTLMGGGDVSASSPYGCPRMLGHHRNGRPPVTINRLLVSLHPHSLQP